jgi:subtilisin family serine protease
MALTLLFLLGSPSSAPLGYAQVLDSAMPERGSSPAIANAPTIDWSAPHIAGQLLVGLSDPGSAAVRARLAAAGMPVVEVIPQLDIAVVRVEEAGAGLMGLPAGPGEPEALARAAARAETLGARWSEPNYLFELHLLPNDPDYAGRQAPYLSRLEMPEAWDKTTGRPEIVIAILDTGINFAHPDLSAGIWTNPAEIPGNGLDDEGNGFIDDVRGWDFAGDDNLPDDDHGHGTHVAGIAAARISNATGIAGMAGGATLMPVDVFRGGIGAYADLIQAILYAADNGAHVINMSLGATSYSRGEEAAVNYAWERGVVVVASAGNSGANIVSYPAAHTNAIAVAATDSLDNRAGFSTWGDFVDVAAPGVSVWSSYRAGYASLSGTSMAAPHVSGLAALIRSADATLTPAEVRGHIEGNTDDLGTAGWDPYFGHGRINARLALENVAVLPGPVPISPPIPDPTWPAGCRDVVQNGTFDDGTATGWRTENVDVLKPVVGPIGPPTWAARFPGGVSSHSSMSQEVTAPQNAAAATLAFYFRIETTDPGLGSSPTTPWDDSFTVELRASDGTLLRSLLRTGNSADTSSDGLPWDEYLHVLDDEDLELLESNRPLLLSFEAQNDGDSLATTVWVDGVRLCVSAVDEWRVFLPHVAR